MKLRATLLIFTTFCFLATIPTWAQGTCYTANNLVVNCGFETGSFSGWTTIPASSGSDFFVEPYYPHSGTYSAWFGAVNYQYDTIEQTLPTIAGEHYNVDFWLQNDYSGPASFIMQWDGITEYSASSSPFGYTEVSLTLTAAGNDTILFAGYQLPSYYNLDDVFVGTPEPGTLILFGSGMLGLAGVIRRKMGV